MMSKWDRLEMAAFIQEADDVYTTKDGFGIVCVKGAFSRIFVLEELGIKQIAENANCSPDGGSAF